VGQEIERKFLVKNQRWQNDALGVPYCQGYLSTQPTVRVRIAGDQAFLTIKGPIQGISRLEYEYPIPLSDAQEMLDQFCGQQVIRKKRYTLSHQQHTWIVDVFEGQNQGLIIAEIELPSPDTPVDLPNWVGQEVSSDFRYQNACLLKKPYSTW